MKFIPRPKQREVLRYRRGRMGVSAVPGSGKTQVLSALAAQIIASGVLEDDQEVLVVTLVNSAVDNFSSRINTFINERGLLSKSGYLVRTLHGLAHDIVRERPALLGLADDFQIIDERAAAQIRTEAAKVWLHSHPDALDDFIKSDIDEGKRDWIKREQLPALVDEIALGFIRSAKDLQCSVEMLKGKLDEIPLRMPLAEMGYEIYADYQRALNYRGAVDFDDLIRLALQALQLDPQFLERKRWKWPFILEDEAQDSSRLQEDILRLLTGPKGNWVRVGDPNQAIYETFTTANPEHLRHFLAEKGVARKELPNSGRSRRSIINLANHLIEWTNHDHPVAEVRNALSTPLIQPTPPGDPQPNPEEDPSLEGRRKVIYLSSQKYTPQEEISEVVKSLKKWLPEHPDQTAAVLAPRNKRAIDLVAELRQHGIDPVENLLQSTTPTRQVAGALAHILRYLADPQSSTRLATVYKVWRKSRGENGAQKTEIERLAGIVHKCSHVEDFLWPKPGREWQEALGAPGMAAETIAEMAEFRETVCRWQGAILLPVDQTVLTLAQDLFQHPADLALVHKLGTVLRQAGNAHTEWRLPELAEELVIIARNERKFLGFSPDDTGFEPDNYKGRVVVATMHKAKGLEWDRVYLMSVNNYDFPSAMAYDQYISEKWYIRDSLNLQAEALAQLRAVVSGDVYAWPEEGKATLRERLEYSAERLRLLYVGITRARKELIVTWNTGQRGVCQPALPLAALTEYWEAELNAEQDAAA